MAHTFPTRKTESARQLSGPITTTKPVILTNIPRTNDVFDMVSLLRSAGTSVTWLDLNTLQVDIQLLATDSLDIEASRRTRAVDLLVAALAKDQDDFILPRDCSFGDRSSGPHVLERLSRQDSAVCECFDGKPASQILSCRC